MIEDLNVLNVGEFTPPKINIEPENDGLEDDFPFPGGILRFHVNLPGCIYQRRAMREK